jgi:hypothetical protein
MNHPYKQLNQNKFWKSVSSSTINLGLPKFTISNSDKIMSAGSCFASNIISYLESEGLEYLRVEKRPRCLEDLTDNFFYDTYSTRYGNIYNPKQLLQLIQRANGEIKPAEEFWKLDNKFIDPYRPGLKFKPESEEEFLIDAKSHLAKTISAISQADVFIFTSGLAEVWYDINDQIVYPACPGTVSGVFDPSKHYFRILESNEIVNDLINCREAIMKINPDIKFIFTISPVPMVATASEKSVVTANSISKTNLLHATIEMCDKFTNCEYFPAYEMVFLNNQGITPFESDGRSIKKLIVDFVMGQFFKYFEIQHSVDYSSNNVLSKPHELIADIIQRECEEQRLGE